MGTGWVRHLGVSELKPGKELSIKKKSSQNCCKEDFFSSSQVTLSPTSGFTGIAVRRILSQSR